MLLGAVSIAQAGKLLEPVVVSASRSEQKAFDAPASVTSVPLDPFSPAAPPP